MNEPCESRAAQSGGTQPARPGLAGLAGRISAWTTRGVLSAMILVAGLGFGRQVIQWWAEEPFEQPTLSGATSDAVRLSDAPTHQLDVGDTGWRIFQQEAAGSREQAAAALRARCREITLSAPFPSDDAGPAERRLLQRLADRQPVDEAPGQWQLYETDGPMPLVAGTRFREGFATDADRRVAPPDRRVVTWGIAVPRGPQDWSLYAFRAAAPSIEPFGALPEIPLPPDCRKTLSMQGAGGLWLVHFAGPPQTESWRRHFDSWFGESGWSSGDWRQQGPLWQCRYSGGPGREAVSVEVQCGLENTGESTGLLLITLGGPDGPSLLQSTADPNGR